ncbi:MAG: hypothetical protein GQ569_11930 [Methylococcaceae bacterium]|nr:hypothetical protein [Methylococcaceae bacterium]
MLTAKLFFSVLLFVISAGGVVLPSMQQHQNSENNGVQHPVVIASIAIVALLGFIYLVKDIIDDLRTEPVDTEVEITFWTSAERSNQAQDYCLYLQKYPQGQFEKLARERVNDDCEIEKQPTLEELTAQIEA